MATSICRALGALVRTGRALDAHCLPGPSLAVPSLARCAMLCPRPRVLLCPLWGPVWSVRLWTLHFLLPLEAPCCPVSCPLPTLELVAAAGTELSTRWGPKPLSVPVCKSQRARLAPIPVLPCSQGEPGSASSRCHQPGLPQHTQGRSLCRQLVGAAPRWHLELLFLCFVSLNVLSLPGASDRA